MSQSTVPGLSAVVGHPRLWGEAVRTAFALAPPQWWRRPPFLPRPEPVHLRWRVATATGSPEGTISDTEVIEYLRWRRRQRAAG